MTVVLAIAAAALLLALVMVIVQPEPIEGLGTSQRQDAETAVYVLTFGAILPAALVLGPRLVRRVGEGPNGSALSVLAGILAGGLAVGFLTVRLSAELGVARTALALLAIQLVWWAAAAGLLARSASPRPWPVLLGLRGHASAIWVGVALLAFLCLLAVTRRDSISLLPFILGLVLVVPVVLIVLRAAGRPLPGAWGTAFDVVVVGLVLLAVPDLVVISPDDVGAGALARFLDGVVQFHHDFLLGPANQVLGGDAVLVDTASQYGVASIYFLAGWFQLAPIGYGTFGLLDGILTALAFACGFVVMRLAGVSRPLATGAIAIGVGALVYARDFPVGALPQEGPLRFGLPMLVILALVAGARAGSRWHGVARAAALAVLGLSSIWSLEAFAMTAVTLAAPVCLEARLLPPGERLSRIRRWLLLALAACLVAHLALALVTLVIAGTLPDWGQYLAFLNAFLAGDLGNLTYDFMRFSPALAVAGVNVVAALALVLLVRDRPDIVRREPATATALAGTTAYAIVLFYYFVDRSAPHVLVYVCLPPLLTGTIWLALVLRHRLALPGGLVTGALAFCLAAVALVVAVAWPSIGPGFERSALAHAAPGGRDLGAALDRLWDFPPVNPRSPDGERMLDRHLPGERRSVVLVQPNMVTEILMRSGRSNRLPLADPIEDGFVEDERKPGLREAAAELEDGDRLLLDDAALAGLAVVRDDPDSELLSRLIPGAPTAPLELYALREIDRRFRLRPVARRDGFAVVELERRR